VQQDSWEAPGGGRRSRRSVTCRRPPTVRRPVRVRSPFSACDPEYCHTTHTHTHTHTHRNEHTHSRARAHTHTHMRPRGHTHTHTHTHATSRAACVCVCLSAVTCRLCYCHRRRCHADSPTRSKRGEARASPPTPPTTRLPCWLLSLLPRTSYLRHLRQMTIASARETRQRGGSLQSEGERGRGQLLPKPALSSSSRPGCRGCSWRHPLSNSSTEPPRCMQPCTRTCSSSPHLVIFTCTEA